MDVTTVIINYQTPDLLKIAVESFISKYPQIPLLIVDNGSKDESVSEIKSLQKKYSSIQAHFLKNNIYHGPAMDLAARKLISSKYVFFLDSDTETLEGNFLEGMFELLEAEDNTYGVGEIITVNKRGFKSKEGMEILLTPYMLLRREVYLKLPPFLHHGQPTINNFKEAYHKGYKLKDFPISQYILHHWRGTADRFGYGLGLRGKIEYLLNKMGL